MTISHGGFGVTLKIDASAIPTVLDVKFPAQRKHVVNATPHNAEGGYPIWIPTGLRELGEIIFDIMWDASDTVQSTVLANVAANTPASFTLLGPAANDEDIQFNAHVTDFQRIAEFDGRYYAKVFMQPTGKPTIRPIQAEEDRT